LIKRHGYLLLVVFFGGLTTLGVELSASRLLDPFFGNSLIIWANLIGLVLIYLTVGYYLGGRWADQDPRESTLFQITAWASFAIGLIPFISAPILRWSVRGFASFDAGILAGSLLGVLIVFSVPITLLGTVSPFAIRLALEDVEHGGNVAGSVYALSTLGSILGTFLPVLILIPNIGTRRTFLFLAVTMFVLSLGGLFRTSRRRGLAYSSLLAILLALGVFGDIGPLKPGEGLLYETESRYNYIQVVQEGDDTLLLLNEGQGVHSIFNPNYTLVYGIWDYFLVAPFFNEPPYRREDVGSLLLIGSAAGTIPKAYTKIYGPIPIDGVEIDPGIIEVGRRFFAMNEPNFNVVTQDGRFYLANVAKTYDVVGVDAYRPPYIPFQLTTQEFFREIYDHLTDEGVVAINAGRTATDYSLIVALGSTMKTVFPNVYVIDALDYGSSLSNSLLVGTKAPSSVDNFIANAALLDQPALQEVAGRSLNSRIWEISCEPGLPFDAGVGPLPGNLPDQCLQPFTDDKAPVEQVTHGIILRYVLGQ
jgi:predicted membrane-bound spermidine synthase